jgi:hypothetical protein
VKKLLFVVCLFLIAGCHSRVDFTPYGSANYPSRTTSAQIAIFTELPATPFIELGYLESYFDTGIRMPWINIDKLKREAADVGADAMINLSCTPEGVGWGPAYCQGTAIRFMTK